jgi:hypothetical protein
MRKGNACDSYWLFDINYLEVLGNNTFEYCLYHLLENDETVADFLTRYKNKTVWRKALFS